jgi:hypothetical protein
MTMPMAVMTMVPVAMVSVAMVSVAMMPMGLVGSAACFQVLLNSNFVKGVCLPFDDGDGVLGAIPETGAETVTEVISGKHRLAVDDFYRPFGA